MYVSIVYPSGSSNLNFVCVCVGHFFVVEADLREFGEVTMDKRFLNLLSMLRHCQRIKELRGGRIIRYQLL